MPPKRMRAPLHQPSGEMACPHPSCPRRYSGLEDIFFSPLGFSVKNDPGGLEAQSPPARSSRSGRTAGRGSTCSLRSRSWSPRAASGPAQRTCGLVRGRTRAPSPPVATGLPWSPCHQAPPLADCGVVSSVLFLNGLNNANAGSLLPRGPEASIPQPGGCVRHVTERGSTTSITRPAMTMYAQSRASDAASDSPNPSNSAGIANPVRYS